MPVRVVIVDDHALLARSLGAWIAAQPGYALAGLAEDGETGLTLCLAARPDAALLDIDLPKMSGLELVPLLLNALPATRLLILSGRTDPYAIWQVVRSGAHGYVEKTAPPETLLQALAVVAGGGIHFSELFQQVKHHWLSQPGAFQKILSDREQEVLRRVVHGSDDEAIARALGIATATVAVHRKNVRQKLNLHNDRELVGYAREWGMDKGGESPAG